MSDLFDEWLDTDILDTSDRDTFEENEVAKDLAAEEFLPVGPEHITTVVPSVPEPVAEVETETPVATVIGHRPPEMERPDPNAEKRAERRNRFRDVMRGRK